MDKIIDKEKNQMASSAWIRSSIASTAEVNSPDINIVDMDEDQRDNVNYHLTDNCRYSPIHLNAYPEIVICTYGSAIIELNNSLINMKAPSLAALKPNVRHCQAKTPENDSHNIVWLLFSDDDMLIMNSLYSHDKQWQITHRVSWKGEIVSKILTNLSKDNEINSENTVEILRADILDLLNQIYQYIIRTEAPEEFSNAQSETYQLSIVKYIAKFIENNLNEKNLTLKFLGRVARFSPNHLNKLFKKYYGITLYAYVIRCRMLKAADLLRNSDKRIKQVAEEVGYDDPLYFSRAFNKYHGFWPTEIRLH